MIRPMDEDAFWALIEQSAQETSTKKARLNWLEKRLTELPVHDIIDFQKWLTICEHRSCTWDLWVAYHAVFVLGSDDGFLYFRSWLVGLGRETFERVIAEPDTLIEVPEVLRLMNELRGSDDRMWTNDEFPEFEALSHVAWEPYSRHSGLDSTTLFAKAVERSGLDEDWYKMRDEQSSPISEEELATRFPRISRYWDEPSG